jgi:hypothetical protein
VSKSAHHVACRDDTNGAHLLVVDDHEPMNMCALHQLRRLLYSNEFLDIGEASTPPLRLYAPDGVLLTDLPAPSTTDDIYALGGGDVVDVVPVRFRQSGSVSVSILDAPAVPELDGRPLPSGILPRFFGGPCP